MKRKLWYIVCTNRGMWCCRSRMKENGREVFFASRESASAYCDDIRESCSPVNNFTSYGIGSGVFSETDIEDAVIKE